MAFKGLPSSPEERETRMKLLEERLNNMATLDDLFGGETKQKRPAAPKWNNVGDKHDMVITGEPTVEQQVDLGGSFEPKYLEEQPDGKWAIRKESELTEGQKNSKLTQIVVPVKLIETGVDATVYFASQTEKKALKDAMAKGVPLVEGTGMRRTYSGNDGRKKVWTVQLAAPKSE